MFPARLLLKGVFFTKIPWLRGGVVPFFPSALHLSSFFPPPPNNPPFLGSCRGFRMLFVVLARSPPSAVSFLPFFFVRARTSFVPEVDSPSVVVERYLLRFFRPIFSVFLFGGPRSLPPSNSCFPGRFCGPPSRCQRCPGRPCHYFIYFTLADSFCHLFRAVSSLSRWI